jgi:malate synthase
LVNDEIAPGTGIDPEHFWSTFGKIVLENAQRLFSVFQVCVCVCVCVCAGVFFITSCNLYTHTSAHLVFAKLGDETNRNRALLDKRDDLQKHIDDYFNPRKVLMQLQKN